MKNSLRIAAAALVVALFSGCKSAPAAPHSAATINTVCPISGEALDGKGPTVDYNGGKVGLCCNNCVGKWNKMDDAAKKAALEAKAKK